MLFLQDLRHAIRTLGKNPGFALAATLTLALGIGANTAIFSIIDAVLLSPLPYPAEDRIVGVQSYSRQTAQQTPRLTGGDLVDIREDGQIFEALSYYFGGEMGVQVAGHAEFTGAYFVNADFFRVFSIQLASGSVPDVDHAAVSRGFAERNFGSGANAVGKMLRIENRGYEISGIMPGGFDLKKNADVWVVGSGKPPDLNRTGYYYPAIAKLRSGVSLENAVAHLDIVGARLEALHPESNRDRSFTAVMLRDQLAGPVRATLYLLMGAVALVLLIACTNVADLMLARTTARSREMAVRAALGAGRRDIIRPLVVESGMLALAGGFAGLLLARAGVAALVRVSSERTALPRLGEVHADWRVLAYVTAISLAASVVFGIVPAWQALRVDLLETLKQGGARGTIGGKSSRARNTLVVAQIALSFVLAVGAGLLLRSFAALTHIELGYHHQGILVMYAHAPARTLHEHLAAGHSLEELLRVLAAIPGVTSTSAAMGLPAGQYSSDGSYAVEGKQILGRGPDFPHAGFRLSSPGYFATLGIPLKNGRDFSSGDQYGAPPVAIISEALARESFSNEDPIGRRFECWLDSNRWMTIVGVVGDVRQSSPASPPAPELYMPLVQHPYYANEVQVVMRTAVEPGSLTSAVRQRVRATNPEIAMKFQTMDAMVADSIAKPRLRLFLVGMFAGLALVLAMIGVYGVMSYVITERTSEFGLRVAMGAVPKDILALVLGRALRLAAGGLAIGALLSVAFGRVITSVLFGVTASDAATYIAASSTLLSMTLLAAAIPAWRASRVDAVTALRQE